MVLIISISNDNSTTEVIKWLDYYKIRWIRINSENNVKFEFIKNDIIFRISNIKFKLSEITAYWYRRGHISNELFELKKFKNNEGVEYFKYQENYYLRTYFYSLLKEKKSINDYLNGHVNKLLINDIAKELGLKVPKSYILESKKEVKKIKHKLITKTISGNPHIMINGKSGILYTSEVKSDNIPDFFEPSLFQEYIDKKYELRIFYLNEEIYSMAIFSQNDNQTSVDFRIYNTKKPNRNVPFNLPNKIKSKLINFMNKIKINCGSIDMIVTPEFKYYFLEVNPIGQFGMVSEPCNYNLEKIIAKHLIS